MRGWHRLRRLRVADAVRDRCRGWRACRVRPVAVGLGPAAAMRAVCVAANPVVDGAAEAAAAALVNKVPAAVAAAVVAGAGSQIVVVVLGLQLLYTGLLRKQWGRRRTRGPR